MNVHIITLLKGIHTYLSSKLSSKQDTLVSGTNIKTVNDVSILGEGNIEIKNSSITMFPNVTIFGEPTIQDAQVSDFTIDNYLQFPFMVDFGNRDWEIKCSITTGETVGETAQYNIFDSDKGLAFAIQYQKFVIVGSSNGSTWDIYNNELVVPYTVAPTTTYYIKIYRRNGQYCLEYSTNKEEYTKVIQITSDKSLASKQIVIGKDIAENHVYNGSINLSDAKLIISNKVVWEGMAEVGTATRLAIDLSNIDSAGENKIKTIVDTTHYGKDYIDEIEEVLTGEIAELSMTSLSENEKQIVDDLNAVTADSVYNFLKGNI